MQHTREIPVQLHAISGTEDDARIVQAVYNAAPAYWRLGGDESGQAGTATETFAMLPAGCTRDGVKPDRGTCGPYTWRQTLRVFVIRETP